MPKSIRVEPVDADEAKIFADDEQVASLFWDADRTAPEVPDPEEPDNPERVEMGGRRYVAFAEERHGEWDIDLRQEQEDEASDLALVVVAARLAGLEPPSGAVITRRA